VRREAPHDTHDQELPARRDRIFFTTGSKAGIQPSHATKLSVQLFQLNRTKVPGDMDAPGWELHSLHGDLEDHWTVKVSGNWRLIFTFEGENAILVDYRDYH
jgi:proteic killer suppression protein